MKYKKSQQTIIVDLEERTKEQESSLGIKDATHYLKCSHQHNRHFTRYYHMKCIYLTTTHNNTAKILLFGKRYQKGYDHEKRIRYVDPNRLTKIEKE